ncbi:hypothetical protein FOCC_FOCC016941, partial [Frankliniella occidentalis]
MQWASQLVVVVCTSMVVGQVWCKEAKKGSTQAKATPFKLPSAGKAMQGACMVDVARSQFSGVTQLSVLGPLPLPTWLGEIIDAIGVPVVLLRRPHGPGFHANQSTLASWPRLRTHNAHSDAVLVLTKGTVGGGMDRSLAVLPPRQPRQRVVVLLPHALRDSKELRALLTAVAQAAWRRRLLRLLVIVSEEAGDSTKCAVGLRAGKERVCGCTAQAYTMRPYPAVCRHMPASLLLECSWTSTASSPAPGCLSGGSVFTEPRLLDLRGCRFHAAVSVESPFAMYSSRRGKANGIAGDLLNEWARYGNFSVSVTDKASRNLYYEYAVPTGLAPSTSLVNLFNELEADVWVYVNIALVVVAAVVRVLWRHSSRLQRADGAEDEESVPSLVGALTVLAAAMVEVPAPARWRREPGSPLRIMLTCWILFCLVLNTAYESMLLSRLTTSVEDDNIHSLEELAELEMPLYVSPSVLHYMRMDVFGMAFTGVAVWRNITALWVRQATLYALQRLEHRYHDGAAVDYSLHSFGRTLDMPVTFIVFPKGVTADLPDKIRHWCRQLTDGHGVGRVVRSSPLEEQANHVLERLLEAGVLSYWMAGLTDVKRWAALRARGPDRVTITMKHVNPVFYMLEIGQGAAFVAFLGELWYARRAARRARRQARAATANSTASAGTEDVASRTASAMGLPVHAASGTGAPTENVSSTGYWAAAAQTDKADVTMSPRLQVLALALLLLTLLVWMLAGCPGRRAEEDRVRPCQLRPPAVIVRPSCDEPGDREDDARVRVPDVYQLLPHLLQSRDSLRPIVLLGDGLVGDPTRRGSRSSISLAIGVVGSRGGERAVDFLEHLVDRITADERDQTLIVVLLEL